MLKELLSKKEGEKKSEKEEPKEANKKQGRKKVVLDSNFEDKKASDGKKVVDKVGDAVNCE